MMRALLFAAAMFLAMACSAMAACQTNSGLLSCHDVISANIAGDYSPIDLSYVCSQQIGCSWICEDTVWDDGVAGSFWIACCDGTAAACASLPQSTCEDQFDCQWTASNATSGRPGVISGFDLGGAVTGSGAMLALLFLFFLFFLVLLYYRKKKGH